MLDLKVPGEKILYGHVFKSMHDLVKAERHGIKFVVADSLSEIKKIKQYAPSMKILWKINVKFDGDGEDITHDFSVKFGDKLYCKEDMKLRF